MKDFEKLCPSCMNKSDGKEPCKFCGYTSDAPADPNFLKIGTKIMRRFVVGSPIDSNGEGVTYVCYDLSENKKVCLREYYPTEICNRGARGSVKAKADNEELFSNGIKDFIALANKLRQHNDIPCLLPIIEVFEGNGTGYYISEYTDAITLREFLLRNGGVLTFDQARPIFISLLTSVRALHETDILHLGISPETILICKDGKVRLTGFCTENSRTANGNITPQLYPGFAAIEQYGSIGNCGTWTDVYAIAATLYRVLIGNPPVESTERVTNDTLIIPSKAEKDIPEKVTEALAEALQIMPEDRMKTVEEFRAIISQVAPLRKKKEVDPAKSKYKSYMLLTTIMTVLFIAVAAALIYVFVIMPGDSDDASSKLPPSSNISSEIISSDESSSSEESANIGSIKVLDFTGKKYQEIVANIDYSRYNFVIETKQYNDDYSAYRVISQSPAAGEMVDPDTEDGKITLKLTVSLGNNYVTMPNVVGMSRTEAELALFKAGFSYVNISVNEIYDSEKPAQCIVSTSPKAGDKVNLDTIITMTFNTYVNDTPSGDSTESSQSNE